jgi:hypothetical protein
MPLDDLAAMIGRAKTQVVACVRKPDEDRPETSPAIFIIVKA